MLVDLCYWVELSAVTRSQLFVADARGLMRPRRRLLRESPVQPNFVFF